MLAGRFEEAPFMRAIPSPALAALATLTALTLAGCGAESPSVVIPDPATEAAATPPPPFRPVATTAVLMRGTIALAAADYWASVSIVVDADGEHENVPADDEEWSRVWASAITLAESGNLLMMAPRALDQGEWMRLSGEMIDIGLEAARVADKKDAIGVLDVGEQLYNLCTECHQKYMPSLPDI
jgi:hypothetical protein